MTFDTLGLSADLLRTVAEEGYTEPTPVQEQAIPLVLAGRDVLVQDVTEARRAETIRRGEKLIEAEAGVTPADKIARIRNNAIVGGYIGQLVANDNSGAMVVADLDASLLPTSSGRRWLRARRPPNCPPRHPWHRAPP